MLEKPARRHLQPYRNGKISDLAYRNKRTDLILINKEVMLGKPSKKEKLFTFGSIVLSPCSNKVAQRNRAPGPEEEECLESPSSGVATAVQRQRGLECWSSMVLIDSSLKRFCLATI